MTLFASIAAAAPVAQQRPQPQALAQTPAQAAPRNSAAWKAAQDFEAFFINQFLELQSATVPTDGPFGGGQTEGVYRSLVNSEYAKAITQQGGIGIADNVYREIIALQEASRR